LEKNGNAFVFEDVKLIAFLAMRGHTVKPQASWQKGRVKFEVTGNIEKDVAAYYANVSVGIQDYVKHLKAINNQIYTLNIINQSKEAVQ